MRTIIYAGIGFALGISFYIPEVQAQLAENPELLSYRIVALNVVIARLFIEGILVFRKQKKFDSLAEENAKFSKKLKSLESSNEARESKFKKLETELADKQKSEIGELSEAKQEVEKMSQSLRAVENNLKDVSTEKQALEVAFQDSQAKLKELETSKISQGSNNDGADDVINLLSLLQQKGRFIDFIMDDITAYPDDQVGAAARVVHQGCESVMKSFFDIKPVKKAAEGEKITLDQDFDAGKFKLLGNVSDEPPYTGRLLHSGWRTEKIELPKSFGSVAGGKDHIITPAELEMT